MAGKDSLLWPSPRTRVLESILAAATAATLPETAAASISSPCGVTAACGIRSASLGTGV
jgi:hypothetical protein